MSGVVHKVSGGSTLLVDGPALLKLVSGRASILGCPLRVNRGYLMRPWRRYPVYAETDIEADVRLGEGGKADVLPVNSIGPDWQEMTTKTVRGSVVMIMGGSDTGKTALATLLANNLAKAGGCMLVCLDPGQSYLSPPTMIGASMLREPIYDPAHSKPSAILPVGYSSAQQSPETFLGSTARLIEWVRGSGEGSIVVDMDGWVEGPGAEELKRQLVRLIKPTHGIFIGGVMRSVTEECESLGCQTFNVEKPNHILERGQNARKEIRAMAYRRFLKDASVRTIPLKWVRAASINESINDIASYAMRVSALYSVGRAGLLCYLADEDGIIYKLGILQGYDPHKNVLKVYTSMEGPVKTILMGRLLLSVDGEESGFI